MSTKYKAKDPEGWTSWRRFFCNKFIYQKSTYIHNNPGEDKIVEGPDEYLYSSARNYADINSLP